MLLSEVFNQLTHGELRMLKIGGAEDGGILPEKYPNIVSHVNLGLTTLYKRFNLKEGRITIAIQPGRITYPLHSDYAVSNQGSQQAVKYLLDTVDDPFEDDILKVERIYTDCNWEMGIQDLSDKYSVFTPTANTLRLPLDIANGVASLPAQLKTKKLDVVYRANHPILSVGVGYFDPDRVEIELPYSHLEPLLLFIASRINNPIGMANEFHSGNNYAAKFEASCKSLEDLNLESDQGSQNTRLARNGWA